MSASVLSVPNPLDSDESFARYYGDDVPGLSPLELLRQLWAAQYAITVTRRDEVHDWNLRRRALILAEFHRRGLRVRA